MDEHDIIGPLCTWSDGMPTINMGGSPIKTAAITVSKMPHVDVNNMTGIMRRLNERTHLGKMNRQKSEMLDKIKKVIFNNPATIVIWADNVKTIVKCDSEKFDPEKGLAMAIAKRFLGDNNGYYYEVFDKWLPKKKQSKKKK